MQREGRGWAVRIFAISVGSLCAACLLIPPRPEGVSHASRRELVDLGRSLFSERSLSQDGTLSCASCHVPSRAFADSSPRANGIGIEARRRNTPTILNVDLQPLFDWDGRAATLREQLGGVFSEDGDFGLSAEESVKRLSAIVAYRDRFRRVFGRKPDVVGLFNALTAYQETLTDRNSRFDRYYLGGDSAAFNAEERRGWQLFRGLGCSGCHVPVQPEPVGIGRAVFTDYRFHNLGVGFDDGVFADTGRYAVSRDNRHFGAFKTPSLRNVAITAPYMHDVG